MYGHFPLDDPNNKGVLIFGGDQGNHQHKFPRSNTSFSVLGETMEVEHADSLFLGLD